MKHASVELKVEPKSTNIAGLQPADLIAHLSRRDALIEHGLMADNRDTFGARIAAILRDFKYHRGPWTHQVEGMERSFCRSGRKKRDAREAVLPMAEAIQLH